MTLFGYYDKGRLPLLRRMPYLDLEELELHFLNVSKPIIDCDILKKKYY